MLRSSASILCFLATFAYLATAQDNIFVRQRREYCAQGNLCLTSFDWCQVTRANTTGAVATGYCDQREAVESDDFLYYPGSGTLAGLYIFSTSFYNLTWINADSDYPVKIDFTLGPSKGLVNNTAPIWSRNITESYFVFRPWDIFSDLNVADTSTNVSYAGYAVGWPCRFTISQPDRVASPGVNTTDESNWFRISDLSLTSKLRTIRREYENDQADQNRRWKLGVGIGVGLGAPLLMLLTYIFGRSQGKKSSARLARKPTSSRKGSSGVSESDSPIPA